MKMIIRAGRRGRIFAKCIIHARIVVRDVEEGFDSSLAYVSRFHKSIFVRDCWRKFDIAARR